MVRPTPGGHIASAERLGQASDSVSPHHRLAGSQTGRRHEIRDFLQAIPTQRPRLRRESPSKRCASVKRSRRPRSCSRTARAILFFQVFDRNYSPNPVDSIASCWNRLTHPAKAMTKNCHRYGCMGPDSGRSSTPAGSLLDASTTCLHSASGVDRVLAHYGVGCRWGSPPRHHRIHQERDGEGLSVALRRDFPIASGSRQEDDGQLSSEPGLCFAA